VSRLQKKKKIKELGSSLTVKNIKIFSAKAVFPEKQMDERVFENGSMNRTHLEHTYKVLNFHSKKCIANKSRYLVLTCVSLKRSRASPQDWWCL